MGRLHLRVRVLLLACLAVAACGSSTSTTSSGPAASGTQSGIASSLPTLPSRVPLSCPGRPAKSPSPSAAGSPAAAAAPTPSPSPAQKLVGVPAGLPPGGGFASFAVIVPGALARSGTPSSQQFDFLKATAWKGIVDVRTTDDTTYSGFAAYGFHYLFSPVEVDTAPTDSATAAFLCFVTDPANQPVLVHDNSGLERVGVFIALYRYSVQGWEMPAALEEEFSFGDSLSTGQIAYLTTWATNHPPGELRV